jgi:enamine deaminase RidA (YjgF/YER057c/UK114 family)
MPRRFLLLALAALTASGLSQGLAQRNKKNQEPKTQVLPLPPQLPMALAADTDALDFHISPLLRSGGLSAQIRQSLNDLIRDTRGETIVKLRAFVAGVGDARRVQAEVGELFTEHKLPLPVLSSVQVGSLGDRTAQVVIEAVVAGRRSVNPNGLAFFTGQRGAEFREALEKLKRSTIAAAVSPDHILSCTCFASDVANYSEERAQIQSAFPNSAISVVQPLRDPPDQSSLCQAVGQLSRPPEGAKLVLLDASRVSLVHSRQLVFTGLQLTFGSFRDDAQEAISRLQRAATSVEPVESPVEINAFAVDIYAASAVRKSTSVPPAAFTAQPIEALPAMDASAGIEAIFAPNIGAPVTLTR